MNGSTSVPRWRVQATVDVLKQSLVPIAFHHQLRLLWVVNISLSCGQLRKLQAVGVNDFRPVFVMGFGRPVVSCVEQVHGLFFVEERQSILDQEPLSDRFRDDSAANIPTSAPHAGVSNFQVRLVGGVGAVSDHDAVLRNSLGNRRWWRCGEWRSYGPYPAVVRWRHLAATCQYRHSQN